LTPKGDLVDAIAAAIRDVMKMETELSTTGGTSDGRFIADICPQVVEFGPTNATIHQVNERLPVIEVETLPAIYLRTLEHLLMAGASSKTAE
jgi:succinyl-diaminopimelate desuccinylase